MALYWVVISPREPDTEADHGSLGSPAQVTSSGNGLYWRQKLESRSLQTHAAHLSGKSGREHDHSSSTSLQV